MASSIDHKKSDPPCKRRKLPLSLSEVASKKELHHHLPALLSGRDVNELFNDLCYGRTVLLMALLEGCSLETFNVLRAAGADLGVSDWDGDNALHCALLGDCSNEVIDQLLRYSQGLLYQENIRQKTPLHVAAKRKRFDHFLPTILQDRKIYLNDSEGMTPLLLALYGGCSLETFNGLKKAGADIREKDKKNNNALHYALERGCSNKVIDQLLEYSSQLMYEDNHCRQTPLSYAARMKRFHHLIPFIVKDGQVNYEDSEGMTPLFYALSSGCSLEDFKLLKEAGANLSARYKRDKNALYCALEGGCSNEVISELLDYNWEMLFETVFESTCRMFVDEFDYFKEEQTLHLAAENKRLYIFIPVIVEHHKINYRDSRDRTLLHLALSCKCSRSVEAILQFISPALLNETDKKGNTYLHFAIQKGCSSELTRALLNAGLNPATRNGNGDNALHLLLYFRRVFDEFNQYISVLKELLRGHPEIVGDRDNTVKPFQFMDFCHSNVTMPTLKWTLLQNDAGFQWRTLFSNAPGEDIVSFVEDCNSDLDLLRAYMVTETLSLYDLVKSCYVSPKFIHELRVEKRFVRVLQFQENLRVYEDEVKEIVRMVRVCSSLYGRTLPFPAFENYDFKNLSNKVLDYLSVDDLEQIAVAVNTEVK